MKPCRLPGSGQFPQMRRPFLPRGFTPLSLPQCIRGRGKGDRSEKRPHLLLTCITELQEESPRLRQPEMPEAEPTPWEPAPAPTLQARPWPLSLYITHSPGGQGWPPSLGRVETLHFTLLCQRGTIHPLSTSQPARLAAPQLGRLSCHRPKVPGA